MYTAWEGLFAFLFSVSNIGRLDIQRDIF
jgi:hypothetical protein